MIESPSTVSIWSENLQNALTAGGLRLVSHLGLVKPFRKSRKKRSVMPHKMFI
jgi:hypothetical protein